MTKFHINFLGNRRIMFAISAILITVSIVAVVVRGLNFGIEFEGGTVMDISNSGSLTSGEVEDAFAKAGVSNLSIQTTQTNETKGFIVRTDAVDPAAGNITADAVTEELKLPANSIQVTVIGPDWGANITRSSLLAFLVSIGAIILYISIRFEFKMSITAIASLLHDLIIVTGVYALSGREITPNVIAALLTIMGFSLYDTVVVFHRISDNEPHIGKSTFMDMANLSINEVLMRSINTTLTSLIPVLCLLLFGGESLKDFAFAMSVGMILGSFSSIAVATPLYALWKEREPKYAALKKKYGKVSKEANAE